MDELSDPNSSKLSDGPVVDDNVYPATRLGTPFEGRIVSVRQDRVEMTDGHLATRDVVVHPGAVGVLALDDEQRVVLIRQFRHPVRRYLWEIPAGLKDIAGEPELATAKRELAEEAGLAARDWEQLITVHISPGGSTESATIFLATGLSEVARPEGFVLRAEETDLQLRYVPLAEALDAVLSGRMQNSLAVTGILAARARLG